MCAWNIHLPPLPEALLECLGTSFKDPFSSVLHVNNWCIWIFFLTDFLKKFTFPKRQVSEVLTTFPDASIYNPRASRRRLNIPGLWDILWNWELGRRKAGKSRPGVSWDGNEATCFSLFLFWVNLPLLFLKLWNETVLLPFYSEECIVLIVRSEQPKGDVDELEASLVVHTYCQKYTLIPVIYVLLILDFIKTKAHRAFARHQRRVWIVRACPCHYNIKYSLHLRISWGLG